MRLDEFIKETLLQIAKGVQDAIDEQKGFEINPNEKEAEIQTIKFSISLSTETKAEAGIKVLSAAHDTTSLNKSCRRLRKLNQWQNAITYCLKI